MTDTPNTPLPPDEPPADEEEIVDVDEMVIEPPAPPPPPPLPPAPPPRPAPASPEGEPAPEGAPAPAPEPEPEPEPAAPSPIERALSALAELTPPRLIEARMREQELEPEKEGKAVLCYEVGEIQESRLDDEPAAIKSYSKALTLNPRLLPNLWAIRRVFWRRKLWPNLLKLVDAELKFEPGGERRVALLLEKGEILLSEVKDVPAALQCFEEATRLDPAHLEPILALERLYRDQGDLGALFRIMDAHAEASTHADRKAAILLSLARLEEQLPDARYDRRREILLRALAVSAQPGAVLLELERIARAEGRPEDLIDVLDRQRAIAESAGPAAAGGEPSAPPWTALLTGFAIGRLQARLLEKQGRPDAAWDQLRPWLDRLPDHPLLLGELRGLAARLGRWSDLADLLAASARASGEEAPPAIRLEQALALLRADRADEARTILAGFVAEEQPHPLALALLTFAELGRPDSRELPALLAREARLAVVDADATGTDATATAAWRADLHTLRAVLLLQVGDEQAPEAEAALREALATLPGHAPASDLLEDLLLHQGRFADLVAHHRDALASATGDAALLILEALADVQSVWAPDPAGLVVTLRELVARVPDRPGPALRLADALHETGDLAGEVAVRVALADAGPPDAELAVDQRLLAAERCEEGLADPKAAAAHLARVIEAVPQHPEARVRLELLLRRTGDAAGLAAFYQAELDRSLSDEEGTRRALQLARVLERDLGQPAEAAAVFDRLRDRDPTSAPALAALMRLRVSLGEIDRLPPVLDALAELAGEPADRAAFHQLLGELHEDLRHDDAAAEESYLRAYASDPGSPETLAVLEDLALRRADWAKLAELLEEHLRGDVSPTARRRLLSELAWILEAPLENPLRASEHWMNLATCDPPSPAAFWAGVRAAVGRREWGEATGNLEWLAGLARRAGDAALAVALETRAAVFGMVGGMPPGPRLLKLLATEGAGEALVVLAADLAPDHGADAAARLARRAGLTPEAGAELALPVALLWLREGNAPAAAEALAGARTGAVTDLPVLAALALAARAGGDRGLEADALERLADHLTDGPAAVGLYRRAAELWPGGEQAARAMRKALDRDPEDRELLERFTKALGDLGRHAEAAQVLGYRLGRLHADAEEVAMRLQRAGLRREHLGDLVGAARDYQAVLKLDPDHPEALWELARLLAADGDLEGAEPLLRRRLQLSAVTREEAAFRATCWLLVEVLERGGQPVGEALDVVDAVLAVLPGDLDALEWKHAVLLRARDFGGAVGALTERYRNVSDPKERARGEIRKAKLHRDLAANDEEARHALERARELDPTNPEVLLELVDLYRRFGDAGGVANVVGGALDSYREEMGRAAELSETTLRFLADLMERGKQRDLHFFALGALEGLGGATPEEKAKAARYRSEVTDTRPGKLTPDLWSQYLLHPLALGTTTAMFEILGEASYRLWPESLDRYGVGKGNRLTAKSAGGVTKEIFDLADALGIGLEEIYRGGSRPDEIHAVGTEDGAVLVVGDQVGPRLDARGRHQVGRLLASIRLGTLAIPRTSDEDLAVLLTAAVREVNPDFRGDVPESRMEELGKKARKAMSRKDRKALPLVAMSFGQEPLDLPRWRRGLERTCHRVGLICSGDLAASMASLKAAETSAVVAQEALRDLVIFALSTAHADVRKTLGLTR